MNAAERATALLAGEPAECPRCDGTLVPRDLPGGEPFFGPSKEVVCPKCGWKSHPALASVAGKPGDETAAIWLKPAAAAAKP